MTYDLEKISGLPLLLNEEGKLNSTNDGFCLPTPALRKVEDLLSVLSCNTDMDPSQIAYYMYRGIFLKEHDCLFKETGLRYDITILLPGVLGKENVKTLGHYHSRPEFSSYSYPEVYEVLHGEALYVLQKKNGESILDMILVKASPGEKLLVPPDYGHVTINIGNTPLVMSNLMASNATSVHREYLEKKGAAYHVFVDNNHGLKYDGNNRYGPLPSIREVTPKLNESLGLFAEFSLYQSFVIAPYRFKYLVSPQEQGDLLTRFLNS